MAAGVPVIYNVSSVVLSGIVSSSRITCTFIVGKQAIVYIRI